MNELTLGELIAVLGIFVSLCSIASFYFGRKKAASDDARETGGIMTDLRYIKESVERTSRAVDNLSTKMDVTDRKREDEYRELLVEFTKLQQSYKSLEHRVENIENENKHNNQ